MQSLQAKTVPPMHGRNIKKPPDVFSPQDYATANIPKVCKPVSALFCCADQHHTC